MIHPTFTLRAFQLLLLAIALLASAASSPAARRIGPVPFQASFDTVAESSVEFPIASVHVVGEGRATQLGQAWTETTNQQVNLLTGQGTATYHFLAANGDELEVVFAITATPLPAQSGLTLSGNWTITGGTGRYAKATGSGTTTGEVLFISETLGLGHFIMDGTISPPIQLK